MKNKPKILVVEDELLLLEALTKVLLKQDWDVYKARDGEEGLRVAGKVRPDLILLDIVMPKMDGLTMLKKIRDSAWGQNIPVLILSNLDQSDKISNAMNLLVSGYIVKSNWKIKDLVDKIKTTLA
jgi:DNA-binding response OmpR family regulator